MKWTDTFDIAYSLEEKYPDIDNINIRYTDLQQWVYNLEGFTDDLNGCNEKILEAIQMAWIEERE